MEFPSPPNIILALSQFRTRGLFCDVRLKFSQQNRQEFFAHRVVLAASSAFLANQCVDVDGDGAGVVTTSGSLRQIVLPSVIEDETISFLLCWMYNEAPKLELNLDEDFKKNFHSLSNLSLAVKLLGIQDLRQFLEQHFLLMEENGGMPIKEEGVLVYAAANKSVDGDNSVENGDLEDDSWYVHDLGDASNDEEGGNEIDIENGSASFNRSLVPLIERLPSPGGMTAEKCIEEATPMIKTEISDESSIFISLAAKRKRPSAARSRLSENGTDLEKLQQLRKEGRNQREKEAFQDLNPEQKKRRKKGPVVSCDKCGMDVRKYELTNHNKTHHGAVERPHWKLRPSIDPIVSPCFKDGVFRCSLCDFVKLRSEVNGTLSRFYFHCARHFYHKHSVLCPNIAFPCPEENCEAILYGRVGLNNHKVKVHEEAGQKTPCPICGLEMKEGSLKTHIYLLHNTDHLEVSCMICGKVFSNPFYLKMHSRHHKEKEEIVCELCDFKANNQEVFTQHSFREHGLLLPAGTKLHECTECDYKSPVKRNLAAHTKKHVESFFKCPAPDCLKSFKRQQLCEEHFSRVHHSRYSSKCPECEQVFHSQTGIRYHLWRVHRIGKNGAVQDDANFRLERPYKCAYCNHTSGLSGNVRKHVKNIHPDLPIEYVDLRKVKIAAAEYVKNHVSPISDQTYDSQLTRTPPESEGTRE